MLYVKKELYLCNPDPWIILHKLDSPTKMRYIGQRFASCGLELDEHLVPASIAPWVARIGEPCVSWRHATPV